MSGRKRRIESIPTVWNGVFCRSRLEAKWACFMDLLAWDWEYEPITLGSCIPDFVVTSFLRPTLIECKPAFEFAELAMRRGELHRAATEWILEDLEVQLHTHSSPNRPEEEVTLDFERVQRGEDAIVGRRAIVVGTMLHRDRARDAATIDGQHYLIHCDADVGTIGLGRLGEPCLTCGRTVTEDDLMRHDRARMFWTQAGNDTQWSGTKVER